MYQAKTEVSRYNCWQSPSSPVSGSQTVNPRVAYLKITIILSPFLLMRGHVTSSLVLPGGNRRLPPPPILRSIRGGEEDPGASSAPWNVRDKSGEGELLSTHPASSLVRAMVLVLDWLKLGPLGVVLCHIHWKRLVAILVQVKVESKAWKIEVTVLTSYTSCMHLVCNNSHCCKGVARPHRWLRRPGSPFADRDCNL